MLLILSTMFLPAIEMITPIDVICCHYLSTLIQSVATLDKGEMIFSKPITISLNERNLLEVEVHYAIYKNVTHGLIFLFTFDNHA